VTRLSARTLAMAGALTALGIVLLAAILVARAHEDAPPPEASATTEASLAASAADYCRH
jgi:hypothetical protein